VPWEKISKPPVYSVVSDTPPFMACGVPVAAYPVTGPVDVVQQGQTGFCDDDLQKAALACLELDGKKCRDYALRFSWKAAAEEFLRNMVPARSAPEGNTDRLVNA